MNKESFIGVWKLVQYGSGKIHTSQTHLVVKDDVLWEVNPNSVYYENKPGPEKNYTFEEGQSGQPSKVSLSNGFKYLVKKNGNTLSLKLGSLFGYFPSSFEDSGNVGEYILETEEAAKIIGVLPEKIKVEEFKISGLGTLKYDDNLNWWEGKIKFQGRKIFLNISAKEDNKFEPLNKVKDQLKQLETMSLDQIAADHLLPLFNDSWNEDDNDLTHAEFMKKIEMESIILEADGESTICFNDGDLFLGHSICISLDDKYEVIEVRIEG